MICQISKWFFAGKFLWKRSPRKGKKTKKKSPFPYCRSINQIIPKIQAPPILLHQELQHISPAPSAPHSKCSQYTFAHWDFSQDFKNIQFKLDTFEKLKIIMSSKVCRMWPARKVARVSLLADIGANLALLQKRNEQKAAILEIKAFSIIPTISLKFHMSPSKIFNIFKKIGFPIRYFSKEQKKLSHKSWLNVRGLKRSASSPPREKTSQ